MEGAENEVSRQRRVDGDFRRLVVSDFAYHDDVGVVPQDRAQPRRKSQADGRVDLNLRHAFQLILHRVFNRDDFAFG